jgi:hypothetical protein
MWKSLPASLIILVLTAAFVANSPAAQADDYWNGYWNWYDHDYRPYYNRAYYSYPYLGNTYPYYGAYYRPNGYYYGNNYVNPYPNGYTTYYGNNVYYPPPPRGMIGVGPAQVYWR